jgi:TMEM199 family protein
MARLRREEEERTYQRMLQPAPAPDIPQSAHTYAAVHRPTSKEDEGDDDVSYGEVHRQLMLVLNFLVSIIGVAATLWILARWWSTPARLFLTMAGSAVVAIAEVGVYWGYIWNLGEAKRKQAKAKEERKIVQTWVVGQDEKDAVDIRTAGRPTKADGLVGIRRRKKEPT